MLGRIRASTTVTSMDDASEIGSPMNASSLMGASSGVSLDGQSLILPNDDVERGGDDDMSSINTSNYGGGGIKTEMRILGTMGHDEEISNTPQGSHEMIQREEARRLQRKRAETARKHNYERKAYPAGSSGRNDGSKANSAAASKSMDNGTEESDGRRGCLPIWLTDAPFWLKLVIVLSSALLVGAIVLIGVGASLAVKEDNLVQAQGNGGGGSQLPPMTLAPDDTDDEDYVQVTSPPVQARKPTRPPTVSTKAPTPKATGPTAAPSPMPTAQTVTFFATGGRFTGDARLALPDQLKTLPMIDGGTVMFHLGDWNSPFATSCNELSYQENAELYGNSVVPVYSVPGDNEFNDCPDPVQAKAYWYQYNLRSETKYWPAPTYWNVTRQEPDFAENFSYVNNGVLFIGINLVGGIIHDAEEWTNRHAANLQWIDDLYYQYQPTGEVSAMVVIAHADPDIQVNEDFFATFLPRVRDNYALLTIFVHRNLGIESWALEPQFQGIANLQVVVVEGSIWPPMMIQIDPVAGVVDIDQDQWYGSYINGTLVL